MDPLSVNSISFWLGKPHGVTMNANSVIKDWDLIEGGAAKSFCSLTFDWCSIGKICRYGSHNFLSGLKDYLHL